MDRTNHTNTGLMVLSGIAAYALPFPLFLFSYAVLGPLHYLTEMSWLHDRQYFSHGKEAPWFLLALTYLTSYPATVGLAGWTFLHDPTMAAFFAAMAFAFLQTRWLRLTTVLICIAIAKPLTGDFYYPFFGLYLTTLVHVYLFTLIFMIHGALKGRSVSGYLSVVTLIGTGLILLALPVGEAPNLSPYFTDVLREFGNLEEEFARFLGWDPRGAQVVASERFIAFAYTYHYLNWFSKTNVIRWNDISRTRLSVIVTLWLSFVGVYAYSYSLGLKALYFISLGHVFLEFPLNARSVLGIGQELYARTRRPKMPAKLQRAPSRRRTG